MEVAGFSGKKFYIIVASEVDTPYEIAVTPYSRNDNEVEIELNEIIGQRLGYLGAQAFALNLIPTDNLKVVMRLTSKSGNADLYAR